MINNKQYLFTFLCLLLSFDLLNVEHNIADLYAIYVQVENCLLQIMIKH